METYGLPRTVYTVSDISRLIKDLVERQFGDIWIEGEVSNFRRSQAGHLYFTLKDDHSQLPAVCFRQAASYLRFKPRNGESFRARGRLSTYAARGEYQVVVDVLEPAGRGELQAAFERLKARLEGEGLFDSDRKRPLPRFPSRIGIVTSVGSAALRDILSVLERRHDAIDVLVYPTEVQGRSAAAQIAEGVHTLGVSDVDVVIVTRGGGAVEDLWPFNDERVARAIVASEKPVISAVGHETDFVISDFVADVRAPTPSAAAEIVVRSKREVLDRLEVAEGRALAAIRYRISELHRFLASRVGGPGFVIAQHRIRQLSQSVDDCLFRLEQFARSGRFFYLKTVRLEQVAGNVSRSLTGMLSSLEDRFRALTQNLGALSPLAVLERGYAVCRRPGGSLVRSSDGLEVGDSLEILLRDETLGARLTEIRASDLKPPRGSNE